MIEQILQAKNLTKARQKVERNGGSAGGDGMRTTELKSYIEQHGEGILTSIVNGKYLPSPILAVEIPKASGGTRMLGIPTVTDRWLQQAVSQQLAMKFEFDFEDESYGFRPKRSLHQAVLQAQKFINDGFQDIVDIDLSKFFDEVEHYKLLQLIYNKIKCPITLRLIRKWLRAPIMINGKLHKRRKGVPQGSPLSPLLSNIMLDQLDKELKRKGLKFVRYADDFSIYCKSKAEAKRIGNYVYLFLRDKLKLPINKEKSGIRRPSNFELLGHAFVPTYKKGEKGKYQLVVKESSWQSLKRKLKAATKKTKPFSFDLRLAKIKEVYRGWVNNYRLASIHGKLKALDEWLRNRLRYCIWTDWKKPERKRKNLIRLGVNQIQAYRWSRTRMGGWATAQSPILKTTITLEKLRLRGYESMLEYYQRLQPEIQ